MLCFFNALSWLAWSTFRCLPKRLRYNFARCNSLSVNTRLIYCYTSLFTRELADVAANIVAKLLHATAGSEVRETSLDKQTSLFYW